MSQGEILAEAIDCAHNGVMPIEITTIITVFNRAYCVSTAIRSAMDAFLSGPVIVVDDASTDNLSEIISSEFPNEIASRRLIFLRLEENRGVTGAKNAGYALAKSEWVLFLDSDDVLIATAGAAMLSTLKFAGMSPIVFFRCKDQHGKLVGIYNDAEMQLNLNSYLQYGSFGEALTVMNKALLGDRVPYPQELFGYEGIGCCRIIRDFGPAILSPIIARVYYIGGADALSSLSGMLARAKYLAIGHWTLSREFRSDMSIFRAWSYRIKAAVYWAIHFFISPWK
jgi:glycosyltransferase involved in cell wall biosynthesis